MFENGCKEYNISGSLQGCVSLKKPASFKPSDSPEGSMRGEIQSSDSVGVYSTCIYQCYIVIHDQVI